MIVCKDVRSQFPSLLSKYCIQGVFEFWCETLKMYLGGKVNRHVFFNFSVCHTYIKEATVRSNSYTILLKQFVQFCSYLLCMCVIGFSIFSGKLLGKSKIDKNNFL